MSISDIGIDDKIDEHKQDEGHDSDTNGCVRTWATGISQVMGMTCLSIADSQSGY